MLLPQGHALLLTARPDSLEARSGEIKGREAAYRGCARLRLGPLTPAQQRAVLAQPLRRPAEVEALLAHLAALPPSADGVAISGSPCVLAMIGAVVSSRTAAGGADGGGSGGGGGGGDLGGAGGAEAAPLMPATLTEVDEAAFNPDPQYPNQIPQPPTLPPPHPTPTRTLNPTPTPTLNPTPYP